MNILYLTHTWSWHLNVHRHIWWRLESLPCLSVKSIAQFCQTKIILSFHPPQGRLWLKYFNSHAICWWNMKQHVFLCCEVTSVLTGGRQEKYYTRYSSFLIIKFTLRSRKCTPVSDIHEQDHKRGLLPFSCSAASLSSGNLNPTLLLLRISLWSCKQKHKNKPPSIVIITS